MILKFSEYINESSVFSGIDLIEEFNYLNKVIFDNELTIIPLKWNNHKKTRGVFKYYTSRVRGNILVHYDKEPWIEISKFYNFSLDKIRNTLAHEMLHYWFWFKRIKEKDAHGPIFYSKMLELNKKGIVTMSIYDETPATELEILNKEKLKNPIRIIRIIARNINNQTVTIEGIGFCTNKVLTEEGIKALEAGLYKTYDYKDKEVEIIVWESDEPNLKMIPIQTKLSKGLFSLKTYKLKSVLDNYTFVADILKEKPIYRKTTIIP